MAATPCRSTIAVKWLATSASPRPPTVPLGAAYYSGGQWIDIGDGLAPGNGINGGSGVESMATCINDNGLVSGWWGSTNVVTGSCYTYQIGAGSYTYPSNSLGVLNSANFGATHSVTGGAITDGGWKKWTCGGGLNNSGTLVGCYNDGTDEWGYTFNGSTSTVIPLPSGYWLGVTSRNYVAGINDAGVIVTHTEPLERRTSAAGVLWGRLLHYHRRHMARPADTHAGSDRRQLRRGIERRRRSVCGR